MNRATKLNWIRSGLVVIGSLAFGYLTLEIGFKPFLLRAQQQQQEEVLQNQEETLNRESWEVRQNQEETLNRES